MSQNSQNMDGLRMHHSILLLQEMEMMMEIDRMKRSGEMFPVVMPRLKDGKKIGKAFIASTVGDIDKSDNNLLWKDVQA